MACPLVAGAASLYLEKFPAATPEDVARAIAATATPVTWGNSEGEGRGDAQPPGDAPRGARVNMESRYGASTRCALTFEVPNLGTG